MTVRASPLLLEPMLYEKVWGGRRLASLGKALPEGKPIGESWELADLSSTSASGAGGGEAVSRIAAGPLKGRTIREALALWGRELAGSLDVSSGFPLLVKFLDARDNLSVQVHPSPAYAASHPGAAVKTECWYVLAADPGSRIYKGVRAGVTRSAFERALGEGEAVVGLLESVPAVVGECHNLPSGTVHALGAGVLVAEVQTPSDTTFRVYDWGRRGRALHIEQAMECIQFGPAPAASSLPKGRHSARLVSTDSFRVYEQSLPAGGMVRLWGEEAATGPRVLIVLSGWVSLRGAWFDEVSVPAGGTCLVPPGCASGCAAVGRPGTRVLVVGLR